MREFVCRNLCCKGCLNEYLQASSTSPSCPCCSRVITKASDIRKAPDVIANILPQLVIKCDNNTCSVPCKQKNAHQLLPIRFSPRTPSSLSSTLRPSTPSASSAFHTTLSLSLILDSPLDIIKHQLKMRNRQLHIWLDAFSTSRKRMVYLDLF